ncbi:TIGR03943 family putative permease subunit [uncultured Friedmanniella sp.]|uniref:TIGR03943 family putative permease subunit n=1 Tax=uncultured Friedmanniella sp. TaxID=335381 RepID=UPI0035CBBD11
MLTLTSVVAILVLAGQGRLTLYIHPRYVTFTVVMALLAGGVMVAAIIAGREEHPDHAGHGWEHDVDPDQESQAPVWRGRMAALARAAVLLGAVLVLLVVPPASLTSVARQSRELVTSGQALESTDVTTLTGADSSTFTVKEWAALLRQGGPRAVVGQHVDATGYVLDRGDPDVFYLTRLMVSCCAVDAQPVGVPVARRQWRDQMQPSDWVRVTGSFTPNADRTSRYATVITPTDVTVVDEPAQPYVY